MGDFHATQASDISAHKNLLCCILSFVKISQPAEGVANQAILECFYQMREVVQRSWPAILLSHAVRLDECRPTYVIASFVVEIASNFRNASYVPEDYDV
jgi:hypothetical protein